MSDDIGQLVRQALKIFANATDVDGISRVSAGELAEKLSVSNVKAQYILDHMEHEEWVNGDYLTRDGRHQIITEGLDK